MIVVKIEIWPWGEAVWAREIGRTYIWNDGTEKSVKRGNYGVDVCRKGDFERRPPNVDRAVAYARTGEVKNYPRLSYNVWRLVIRALRSAFPEEK